MPKAKLVLLFAGAAISAAAVALLLKRRQAPAPTSQPLPEADFDLNACSNSELSGLGLRAETVDRILENRPYRNKLELVSRMIVSEAEYQEIHHRIRIEHPDEPVKVAS
jgi:hypothetical protein